MTERNGRGWYDDFVARNPGDDQSVYLQVTRGVAKRDHAFPTESKPTVFMMSESACHAVERPGR